MVMYEEAAAVPLHDRWPRHRSGSLVAASGLADRSLSDGARTGRRATGRRTRRMTPRHARSLARRRRTTPSLIARFCLNFTTTGHRPACSCCGVAAGNWSYYPGHASQLFDLEADPGEMHDLAPDPALRVGRSTDMHAATCTPSPTLKKSTRAPSPTRHARIAELGGRDAIKAMTNYDHTPVES